jgi:hypothetical protein
MEGVVDATTLGFFCCLGKVSGLIGLLPLRDAQSAKTRVRGVRAYGRPKRQKRNAIKCHQTHLLKIRMKSES